MFFFLIFIFVMFVFFFLLACLFLVMFGAHIWLESFFSKLEVWICAATFTKAAWLHVFLWSSGTTWLSRRVVCAERLGHGGGFYHHLGSSKHRGKERESTETSWMTGLLRTAPP